MTLLQMKFYCQKQVAVRFLRPPTISESLIVTIPGGPCLSGNYFDEFLVMLADKIKINVCIIDLPNHGDSILSPKKLPLSYQACLLLINNLLLELSYQANQIILFGQSFGARLAFDVLSSSTEMVIGCFLTGFPYKFQMSDKILRKLAALNLHSTGVDPETVFKNNWRAMLPFYSLNPLAKKHFDALVSNTKVTGNENLLRNIPDIQASIDKINQKFPLPRVGILEADSDEVVPNDNWIKLRKLIPYARFFELQSCGHFPMVEQPLRTIEAFSEYYSYCREK